jgi:hypothetical protein
MSRVLNLAWAFIRRMDATEQAVIKLAETS